MELGEAIAFYRKKRGYTIDELVQLSGVPKGTLNKIMNGITNSPKIETVKAIAKALDVSLEDLDNLQDEADTKKSPETDTTASGETNITLDESNALLVKLGYIKPGEDLSDEDLAFLSHLIGLLDAWFESH